MTVLTVSGFAGTNPVLHPTLLPASVGTVSLNQRPGYGDLRPWNAPGNVGVSVGSGTQTIYRMGKLTASDTNYWLQWPSLVHAVVGPNVSTSDERTYYTGDGVPKWTDTTKAIAGASYPNSYRQLGIPAPTTAPTVTLNPQTYSGTRTSEDVYYVYTYVSDAGEESAPSPVSTDLVMQTGDFSNLSSMGPPPSGAFGINRIRVYRTKSGTTTTQFFFLTEVASTATTASDTGQMLGEVLPTATWLTPPSDLSHLTGMWNGMMAGITGRSVRVCEAFVPYAWPIAYEIVPTDASPVAMATYGQNLVIATNGKPSIVTGGSPDALDQQPLEFIQACVSDKSMVGMGTGVAWAAPDGLAYVGQAGFRLLTAGIMTRVEWQALNPSTIKGAFYEGRYYGTYTVAGVTKMFMLDLNNTNGMYFMDFGVDAIYNDVMQDALYVLSGTTIQRWDTGSALTTTFRSKVFVEPRPVQSFACAQVRADSYPVTFNLYADGALVHAQTVASQDPFKLAGGYWAREFQIELISQYPVQSAHVAHSVREIAQI